MSGRQAEAWPAGGGAAVSRRVMAASRRRHAVTASRRRHPGRQPSESQPHGPVGGGPRAARSTARSPARPGGPGSSAGPSARVRAALAPSHAKGPGARAGTPRHQSQGGAGRPGPGWPAAPLLPTQPRRWAGGRPAAARGRGAPHLSQIPRMRHVPSLHLFRARFKAASVQPGFRTGPDLAAIKAHGGYGCEDGKMRRWGKCQQASGAGRLRTCAERGGGGRGHNRARIGPCGTGEGRGGLRHGCVPQNIKFNNRFRNSVHRSWMNQPKPESNRLRAPQRRQMVVLKTPVRQHDVQWRVYFLAFFGAVFLAAV
jgi:hypothetical protein